MDGGGGRGRRDSKRWEEGICRRRGMVKLHFLLPADGFKVFINGRRMGEGVGEIVGWGNAGEGVKHEFFQYIQ